MEKSNKKLILVLVGVAVLVIGGIIAGIAGLVGGVFGLLNKASAADFYDLGGEQIPSVKFVLGEERRITSINNSTANGVITKEYAYTVPGLEQSLDASNYFSYLCGEAGFSPAGSPDFDAPVGSCAAIKRSADGTRNLLVQIDYNTTGYVVTLVK